MRVDFYKNLYIIESRKEGEVAIMLIQFNFKNFKSFREEATLDLSAAKMTEFSDRVVSIGSEKILPVAAIYGANASGKSNIYNAFEYMTDYVVDSFKYGDEEEKFELGQFLPSSLNRAGWPDITTLPQRFSCLSGRTDTFIL